MGDKKLTPGHHGEHDALFLQDRKCEDRAQASQHRAASGLHSKQWAVSVMAANGLSFLPTPTCPNPTPARTEGKYL